MAGLKIFLILALLSAVSAGNLGHFQPSVGYSAFGANSYSSAKAAASASAYTSSFGAQIPIRSYENVNNGDGNYKYSYETGNGISAHENGAPRAAGPEGSAVTVDGGFSYRAPDGQQVSLTYTADENGFHPVGSHIPTPPPIPDAILRSLQLNRQHPSSGDDSYNGHFNNGYNHGFHGQNY